MLDVRTLTDLYRHMEWADAAVWTSAFASEKGRTDTKLREYLFHLHLVQRAFLLLWRNEWREAQPPPFDDAQSLMDWGRDYYGEVFAHLETLDDEKISGPAPMMPWANMVEQQLGRAPESVKLCETLLQVPMHSLYHRGQVNARLREIGGAPPLVDYIAWIWLGRPSPDWPPVTQG